MGAFVDHLIDATYEYRKGGEVVDEVVHGVSVRNIYLMPHISEAPEDGEKVDMHFVVVSVDRAKAEAMRGEVLDWCRSYPDPVELAGGPSYIHLGARLGSQDLALRLMALGKVLGLWDVITPATLHFEGKQADELAGRGYVMISGWRDG